MALFFDKRWFDARLAQGGLDYVKFADLSGVSVADLKLMMKDQQEISRSLIYIWSGLLKLRPEELAQKCGVLSLPEPAPLTDQERIKILEGRVETLEAIVAKLLAAKSEAI